MDRELIVVAIHGEGDRERVNADKAGLNEASKKAYARAGQVPPPELSEKPDEAPDILVVMRDEHHHDRVELHLRTWDEVEAFKLVAGYDAAKRHWTHGAKVKVTVAKADA